MEIVRSYTNSKNNESKSLDKIGNNKQIMN